MRKTSIVEGKTAMISLIAHVDEFFTLTGQCSGEEAKRYFHTKTRGQKVVMGLHTMLERGSRHLRDRENYVLTTWMPCIKIEGFTFLSDLNVMLGAASKWVRSKKEEVFIVGDCSLFGQTYRQVTRMCIIMEAGGKASVDGSEVNARTFPFEMWANYFRQHEDCRAKETVLMETDK